MAEVRKWWLPFERRYATDDEILSETIYMPRASRTATRRKIG